VATDPANLRGVFEFSDRIGGEWLIYTRHSLNSQNNWSAGLIYDPDGLNLRLIRCNGPHAGVHVNRLDPQEPAIVVTPHVHYAREKYLTHPRTKEDGYAVPTAAHATLQGAIEHLAAVATLIPEGRLLL
jgi:hypothetical protein